MPGEGERQELDRLRGYEAGYKQAEANMASRLDECWDGRGRLSARLEAAESERDGWKVEAKGLAKQLERTQATKRKAESALRERNGQGLVDLEIQRREFKAVVDRCDRAESALTEALDAMEKVGRKYAGRSGLTAESERVFDELLATAARIRSQIEGSKWTSDDPDDRVREIKDELRIEGSK